MSAARVLPSKKPWEWLREKLAYPMYVIPVMAFLKMEGWVPHQEALAADMLQEYDHEKMKDRVIFISHQWSGWLHPDPKLEQMTALKDALRKLLEGCTSVRSNAILESFYNWHVSHSGAWWKENLPQMFLWIGAEYVLDPPTSGRWPTYRLTSSRVAALTRWSNDRISSLQISHRCRSLLRRGSPACPKRSATSRWPPRSARGTRASRRRARPARAARGSRATRVWITGR